MKRYLVAEERETGRREQAVLEKKAEYVNTNTFSVDFYWFGLGVFSFNETFVHTEDGIGDIIKSSQTGKLENARN